jgi:hypothetical protein
MATYSNLVTGGGVIDVNPTVGAGSTVTAVTGLTTTASEFKKVYMLLNTTTIAASSSLTLRVTSGTSSGIASISASAASISLGIGPITGGAASIRIDGQMLEFVVPPGSTVDLVTNNAQTVICRATYLTYSL